MSIAFLPSAKPHRGVLTVQSVALSTSFAAGNSASAPADVSMTRQMFLLTPICAVPCAGLGEAVQRSGPWRLLQAVQVPQRPRGVRSGAQRRHVGVVKALSRRRQCCRSAILRQRLGGAFMVCSEMYMEANLIQFTDGILELSSIGGQRRCRLLAVASLAYSVQPQADVY